MIIRPITEDEINKNKVASLPLRPTDAPYYGGNGYSGTQVQEAFDKLPILIATRYNELIDFITNPDYQYQGLAGNIPTPFGENHSLCQMFWDILSGDFIRYLSVGDKSLYAELEEIKTRLDAISPEEQNV